MSSVRSFSKPYSKKCGLNILALIPIEQYKNTSEYDINKRDSLEILEILTFNMFLLALLVRIKK